MKLKLDANGHVVVENGMPVYEYDDGSAKPFDAVQSAAAIKRLNTEAKTHREAKEAAEAKAAAYAGIEDPEAARQALQTVASLDGKLKVEIEKVRGETAKALQGRIDAAEAKAKEIESRLHGELIGGGFARSKFIAEKLAIPADVAQAFFGSAFVIENGQMVAKGRDGSPILSKTTGQAASFDEALEVLVGGYERKDSILKADQKGGSGAQPGTGGAGAQKQTMARAEFDLKSPVERKAILSAGVVPVD